MTDYRAKFEKAHQDAVKIISRNMIKYLIKNPDLNSGTNSIYKYQNPDKHRNSWMDGFWCGLFWLAYESTGDMEFYFYADILVKKIMNDVKSGNTRQSNLGFLTLPSCGIAGKFSKSDSYERDIVSAADMLFVNYEKKGDLLFEDFIDSDGKEAHFIKMSDLANVLLLEHAYRITAVNKYRAMADRTRDFLMKVQSANKGEIKFRYYFDVEDGKLIGKKKAKNIALDDIPAKRNRAVSWTVFGFATNYGIKKDLRFFEKYKSAAASFIKTLDSDYCCKYPENNLTDVISMVVAACGFLEMYRRHPEDADVAYHREVAVNIMARVVDSFATDPSSMCNGLVRGCAENYIDNKIDLDKCSSAIGDFFYMDALTALIRDRDSYWC